MSDRFNTAFEPFWLFLEKGMIVRRGVLFVAIWMTLDSYSWAKIYAYNPNPDPLIYAALLGVPSALLAAALKFYNDGRKVVEK